MGVTVEPGVDRWTVIVATPLIIEVWVVYEDGSRELSQTVRL